ncbi:MAG: hypothetical protein B7Z73_01360 [Planctomycetia bacterium 21-64-5]|nr:MAG: hypothetical protein B7Z73_01360 [Planctomycetia bacterium 21-64-5]HQU42946.1 hypothetical protein [Pirellulales bacterium]
MKRFQIDWLPEALDGLADIWLKFPDRQAVNDVANLLEEQLEQDPLGWGTELSEGLMTIEMAPIRLIFTVDEATQVVEVLRAIAWREPKSR